MIAKNLKPSAALSTLRQMTVLGLPGPMMREALSSVIHGLINCDLVTILDIDKEGNIADGWLSLPEIIPAFGLYMEHFHNSGEGETYTTFRDFFRGAATVDLLHRGHGRILDSKIYHEVWRRTDTRYILRAALRESGRACGGIMLARFNGAHDFTVEEVRRMEAMSSYLMHALYAPEAERRAADNAETAEGMLICGERGVVEYASPQGRMLLHEAAAVAPLTAATLSDNCHRWSAHLLARLVGNTRLLSGGWAGAVPVIEVRNRYGRYVIRAWKLGAMADGGSSALYTVSIRRYVPQALRLLQNMEVQALPAREKQVCLLLAQGMEVKEIARKMDVAPSTVITYVRKLYHRFGINSREELGSRLLG